MSFTKHNNLELPDSGTQNWGASINENFSLIEKGPTIKATAGTTIAINDVLYLDSESNFQLALADTSASNEYVGFATSSMNIFADGYVKTAGNDNNPDWFFNPGDRIYLSGVTPGGITSIAPADMIQVGVALQTNEILIRPFGATLTDHDSLIGLTDDDHTQYLAIDNRRSTSGLTVTGNLSVNRIVSETANYINIASGLTISGNVGIGVAAPANALEVVGAIVTTGAAGGLVVSSRDGSGTAYILYNPTGDDLRFFDGADRMVIGASGNIGVGTPTFDGTAAGVLAIANGTAPAAGTANQSYLYAKDVSASSEMHVMNEAGFETEISPHHPEVLNNSDISEDITFSHVSRNVFTGKEILVDMTKVIREVEALTGKSFITVRNIPIEDKVDWSENQEVIRLSKQKEIDILNSQVNELDSKILLEKDTDKKSNLIKEKDDIENSIPNLYIKKKPPKWMQDRGISLK